jgi:hypothetical protein
MPYAVEEEKELVEEFWLLFGRTIHPYKILKNRHSPGSQHETSPTTTIPRKGHVVIHHEVATIPDVRSRWERPPSK